MNTDQNQSSPTIVDVRSPEEFQLGHVRGAINIPVDQVVKKIDQFRKMAKPIIVYCRSGHRSEIAKGLLSSHEITHVENGGSFEQMLKKFEKI